MSRPKKWCEMVKSSKDAIEDFNDFAEDKAVVWADKEITNYKKAMLILVNGNANWDMCVTEEQEKLIKTMVRRAEAI